MYPDGLLLRRSFGVSALKARNIMIDRNQLITVATWNVLNLNADCSRIRRFVEASNADIIAFQELTAEHVNELRNVQGYELHTAEDFWEGSQVYYLAVLSRAAATSTV